MIQDLQCKFGIININNEKKRKFRHKKQKYYFLVIDKELVVCYFFCLD